MLNSEETFDMVNLNNYLTSRFGDFSLPKLEFNIHLILKPLEDEFRKRREKFHKELYEILEIPKMNFSINQSGKIVIIKESLMNHIDYLWKKYLEEQKENRKENSIDISVLDKISFLHKDRLSNQYFINFMDTVLSSFSNLLGSSYVRNTDDKPDYITLQDLGFQFPKRQKYDKFYNVVLNKLLPQTNNYINQLSSAFNQGNLVFVLGAGVSIDCNLPDWNKLLTRLFISIKGYDSISEDLSSLYLNLNSNQPIQIGRLIEISYSGKKNDLLKDIHKYLYDQFDKDKLKASKLFESIYQFISSQLQSLDSIITYNFDDLLQYYCQLHHNKNAVSTIYNGNTNAGKVPIYHVHGYIPHKKSLIDKNQDITFSESIYHKQYSEVYSWNNLIQLNKFSDKTCLFIGSSISDPNIRRLLDVAKSKSFSSEPRHYCLLKEPNRNEYIRKLEQGENHFSKYSSIYVDEIDSISKVMAIMTKDMIEKDMKSLNIQVIWYKEHFEIPEILNSIYACSFKN
ncbi:SIR2 family protein [Flectobacillus sp. DC10W]|uniref:SIR2 family protein n=1 Tax=Flectobacillus longus TaxID=2984207 RepID=A0ABT6YK85_9BACT|nr:SIR2 family protein [Flectobacillus longus]MDI9864004.1 SIR2 family protein [Flectobacillus longus]